MYISPAVSTYMFYPTTYSTLLLERPMPTLQIDPETLLSTLLVLFYTFFERRNY